jgi:hypothetical protein
MNEFLTKEEKERIKKRVEKSMEALKNKYQGVFPRDLTAGGKKQQDELRDKSN